MEAAQRFSNPGSVIVYLKNSIGPLLVFNYQILSFCSFFQVLGVTLDLFWGESKLCVCEL